MIFLSPLWFGAGEDFAYLIDRFRTHFRAAHLHHGWDLYNRFGKSRAALKRAVFNVGRSKHLIDRHILTTISLPTVVY
jgi:hypothetical protein